MYNSLQALPLGAEASGLADLFQESPSARAASSPVEGDFSVVDVFQKMERGLSWCGSFVPNFLALAAASCKKTSATTITQLLMIARLTDRSPRSKHIEGSKECYIVYMT